MNQKTFFVIIYVKNGKVKEGEHLQIFLLNTNDFSDYNFNLCISLMGEKRRKYINSLKHQKAKLLSVAAEWLIKNEVSKFLNKNIEDITIFKDQKGKPYLKDIPLHISISHSGDYAAAAFDFTPIGIDIELIRQIDTRLKNRICTQNDLIFMNTSQNPKEENLNLLKIWTAKEAYFKMIGTGITDFKSISYEDINLTHTFKDSLIITTVTKNT